MQLRQVGLSVVGLIVAVTVVLALAMVWLFLTNPVTVATAVDAGEVSPFIRNLAQVLYQALQGLLKYL